MKNVPWVLCIVLGLATATTADELSFRAQQIAGDLGVGYAVQLLDMNGDDRIDILVVDTNRVVWHENPTWKRHTIIENQTALDNVCIAPYDIDRDGRIDFALGADWRGLDTNARGTIQWLRPGPSATDLWSVIPIGEEPTVHRIRWVDIDGDGRDELIVVPLLGRGTTRPHYQERPVRVLAFRVPDEPASQRWPVEVLNEQMHVTHNFQPIDFDGDGRTDLLVTSFEGVNLLRNTGATGWPRTLIGTGNQQTSPNRGASEIKVGRLAGGQRYIATIEPWHGHQVVVYTPPPDAGTALWRRQVLDEDLKWGHAVWCADLDGDADEELVIGIRDNKDERAPCGVRIYDPQDPQGRNWRRQLVDPGGVAVEDLAAADLDGDGRTDLVAVGRATKNVKIYWNIGR